MVTQIKSNSDFVVYMLAEMILVHHIQIGWSLEMNIEVPDYKGFCNVAIFVPMSQKQQDSTCSTEHLVNV